MITLVIGGSASGKSEFAEQYVMERDGFRIYLATMHCYDEESRQRIRKHREARRTKGFFTIEKECDLQNLILPQNSNVLLEDLSNLLANEYFGTPEEDHAELLENSKGKKPIETSISACTKESEDADSSPSRKDSRGTESSLLKKDSGGIDASPSRKDSGGIDSSPSRKDSGENESSPLRNDSGGNDSGEVESGSGESNEFVFYKCTEGILHLTRSARHLTIVANEIFSDGGKYEEETVLFMEQLANLNRFCASLADRVYEVVCGIPVRIK